MQHQQQCHMQQQHPQQQWEPQPLGKKHVPESSFSISQWLIHGLTRSQDILSLSLSLSWREASTALAGVCRATMHLTANISVMHAHTTLQNSSSSTVTVRSSGLRYSGICCADVRAVGHGEVACPCYPQCCRCSNTRQSNSEWVE